MSDPASGGILPSPDDGPRIWARGVCPLDGYHLIETEPATIMVDGEPAQIEGGWEHVIPAPEIPTMAEALQKIADAHAFETAATAEQIARQAAREDDES